MDSVFTTYGFAESEPTLFFVCVPPTYPNGVCCFLIQFGFPTTGFIVMTVCGPVGHVLFVGAPIKISRSVVAMVAVLMTCFGFWWTISNKSKQHQLGDCDGFSFVLMTQNHEQVIVGVRTVCQLQGVVWAIPAPFVHRPHAAVVADEVRGESEKVERFVSYFRHDPGSGKLGLW